MVCDPAVPALLLSEWSEVIVCDPANPRSAPSGDSATVSKQTTPQCSGPCPAGYRCGPGTIVPILCSPGTYCDIGSARETACQKGTHSNVSGLTSKVACEECPPGYWCNGGRKVACSEATYNPHRGGGSSLDCKPCPTASTTLSPAASSLSDCVCARLYYSSGTNASEAPVCTPCGLGAKCDTVGVTIATLELLPGYWRQGVNATALFRCPDAAVLSSGCQGGTGNPCKPSLHGPFCTLCVDDSLYYDDSECKTCNAQNLLNSTNIVLIVFLLTVLSSTIGCAITNKRAGHSQSRHAHRAGVQGARREARRMLRRLHRWQMVASRMSLSVKMRLVISFFQVVCRAPKVRRVNAARLMHASHPARHSQSNPTKKPSDQPLTIGTRLRLQVYLLEFPAELRRFLESLDLVININFLRLIPLECLGLNGYRQELILTALAPPAFCLLMIGSRRRRRASRAPYLPFSRVAFLDASFIPHPQSGPWSSLAMARRFLSRAVF